MNYIRAIFWFVIILSVSSCNEDGSSTSNKSTQVAAIVNGEEITIHQINFAMASANPQNNLDEDSLLNEILDGLVVESLLVQQAEKDSLERDPNILQAIESAKSKVLAQAVIQRKLQSISTTPSQEAIQSFYKEHQDIFSNRKLFTYQQITIPSLGNDIDKVIEELKVTESFSDFVSWLDNNDINSPAVSSSITSEKLPTELLQALNKLKTGDVGFLRLADGVVVIELNSVEPQPVALEQVKSAIQQRLTAESNQAAIKQYIDELKALAKIEYKGDFALKHLDSSPSNGSSENIDTELQSNSQKPDLNGLQ